MSDTQRIEERAQGRRLARTLIALAELDSQPQNVIDGLWDKVSEINPNKPTPVATTGVYPMTDDEAAAVPLSEVMATEQHAFVRQGIHGLELQIDSKHLCWYRRQFVELSCPSSHGFTISPASLRTLPLSTPSTHIW